jgi:hypothetical protein
VGRGFGGDREGKPMKRAIFIASALLFLARAAHA